MLQNATPLRKSAPWPPITSLMNMSFVLRLPREMHLCRPSSNVPRLPSVLEMLQNPHVLLTFEKVHSPLRLPRESTSERPKMARTCGVFHMLTSKCAFRATTACTFSTLQLPKVVRHWGVLYILTSKCASRHNCALVRHRNFQKWSDTFTEVLYTFWLRNVLRATTARTFSTSQLPKVVRHWSVLYILTSKCASRHNDVLVRFVHFDLEMRFAPQRRAIFHLSSGQLAPHPPL